MDNELQDALDRNAEVFEPTWDESLLFVDAARKYANPDIDAAAVPIAVALADAVSLATGQAVAVEFIDDEMKAIAKNAVHVALGVTEDE